MSPLAQWIGGSTLGALALLGVGFFVGDRLEDRQAGSEAWLSAGDIVNASGEQADSGSAATAAPQDDAATASSAATAKPAAPEQPAAADGPLVIRKVLPIDGPIKYGEWHWDEEGVPDGPLVVTVDLQARVVSVFRDGYEIGAAAVMLGTDEHPTPLGTFPILSKERHNVSEKYGNAPMPWTLRLTWDGVAIHGGSEVERGYASHGCIGVPDPFAARLYDIASKGDRVIITNGQRANIGTALEG